MYKENKIEKKEETTIATSTTTATVIIIITATTIKFVYKDFITKSFTFSFHSGLYDWDSSKSEIVLRCKVFSIIYQIILQHSTISLNTVFLWLFFLTSNQHERSKYAQIEYMWISMRYIFFCNVLKCGWETWGEKLYREREKCSRISSRIFADQNALTIIIV